MDINEFTTSSEPASIDVDDSSSNDEKSLDTTSTEFSKQDIQTVRLGGFFGKNYTIKKEGDKLVYEKLTTRVNSGQSRQVNAKEIDSTTPLNLKKPEIPKYWSPSGNRKNPAFTNCPV